MQSEILATAQVNAEAIAFWMLVRPCLFSIPFWALTQLRPALFGFCFSIHSQVQMHTKGGSELSEDMRMEETCATYPKPAQLSL